MREFFLCMSIMQFMSLSVFALTFGVVPQQSPIHLMKVWNPIVKYLEKQTGEKITLKLVKSIPIFEKALYNGEYDLAYMSPYHYIIAHKKQNYNAKVRAEKNIVGILVTKKHSGITDITMTKNKMFLFPSPNAFAATMLTKYELLERFNINANYRHKYVNSHDSVYKGVARGVGDVGGGIVRTFKNLNDKKTKDSLMILYKTKAYPSHPIAFAPFILKSLEEKLVKAFLELPDDLLHSLSIKKMIKVDDTQYDVIRDLTKKLSLEED